MFKHCAVAAFVNNSDSYSRLSKIANVTQTFFRRHLNILLYYNSSKMYFSGKVKFYVHYLGFRDSSAG